MTDQTQKPKKQLLLREVIGDNEPPKRLLDSRPPHPAPTGENDPPKDAPKPLNG